MKTTLSITKELFIKDHMNQLHKVLLQLLLPLHLENQQPNQIKDKNKENQKLIKEEGD